MTIWGMGCYYRAWLNNPNPEIEALVEIFNNIEYINFAETEEESQLLQQYYPNDPLYNSPINGSKPKILSNKIMLLK